MSDEVVEGGVVGEDLEAAPVEEVEVTKQHTPVQSKIGTKEFNEALLKEFSEGSSVWRSSKALAEKMNVDVVELDNFLRAQQVLCCRPSKTEGVFMYALLKRLQATEQPAKPDPKVEAAMRPLVSEEDRYALASLHSAYIVLHAALDKYALKIHDKNPEAFTQLVQGKDKVEAGIVLLATKLKADVSKLPKV